MRNANKTVTVYRKVWDEETAADIYPGTVLKNVSFFSRISTAVKTDGTEAECEGILRIPLNFANCSIQLRNGDFVCEGALPTTGQRPGTLSDLCPYVFTVVSVTRNDTGKAPHMKVVLK